MTTATVTQIRQGDVLLQRVDPPQNATKTDDAGLLVPGERTGHAHRLVAEVWEEQTGRRVLHVPEPRPLVHTKPDGTQADHDPVTVPSGWWVPVQQRQYVPSSGPVSRARWD